MFDPSLENELRCLSGLARADLCRQWKDHIGTPPPAGSPARLLAHCVAYEMQARRYGGLKPVARNQLQQLAGGKDRKSSREAPPLRIGNRLVREWNGETYVVDVVDRGFEWEGKLYGSLSIIARTITGTQWSGPRFFGLVSRSAP